MWQKLQYLMLHISTAGEGANVLYRRDIKKVAAAGWT